MFGKRNFVCILKPLITYKYVYSHGEWIKVQNIVRTTTSVGHIAAFKYRELQVKGPLAVKSF